MAGNTENQVLVALRAGDIGFAATKLKKMKINRAFFREMVHACIDSENQNCLKQIMWSYYQYWNQETFDDAVKFATVNHKYQYLPIIDELIDRINESQNEEPVPDVEEPKPKSGIFEKFFGKR